MRLRLLAWGETGEHVEQAVRKAGEGPGRTEWVFEPLERVDGGKCPIRPFDPGSVASARGTGWAYAVFPVEGGVS